MTGKLALDLTSKKTSFFSISFTALHSVKDGLQHFQMIKNINKSFSEYSKDCQTVKNQLDKEDVQFET